MTLTHRRSALALRSCIFACMRRVCVYVCVLVRTCGAIGFYDDALMHAVRH